MKEVLESFCHGSGLKVNIQKSRFMSSANISRGKVNKFSSIVHFTHHTRLGKYLGFPMLSGKIKKLTLLISWIELIADWMVGRRNSLFEQGG